MVLKIIRRTQRQHFHETRSAHWKEAGPKQSLAVLTLQSSFGVLNGAIEMTVVRRISAFLGENLHQSVGHDRVEFRKPRYQPKPRKVRIDGNDESVWPLATAQPHDGALNLRERHGHRAQQHFSVNSQNNPSVASFE